MGIFDYFGNLFKEKCNPPFCHRKDSSGNKCPNCQEVSKQQQEVYKKQEAAIPLVKLVKKDFINKKQTTIILKALKTIHYPYIMPCETQQYWCSCGEINYIDLEGKCKSYVNHVRLCFNRLVQLADNYQQLAGILKITKGKLN